MLNPPRCQGCKIRKNTIKSHFFGIISKTRVARRERRGFHNGRGARRGYLPYSRGAGRLFVLQPSIHFTLAQIARVPAFRRRCGYRGRRLTIKVCVPVKRWQKMTPLEAVFGPLSIKATRVPGRFNLVKPSQIANLFPIDSVEKSDLVKISQIISLASIDLVEKSDLVKTSQIDRFNRKE